MSKLIAFLTFIFINFGTQALSIQSYEDSFKNITGKNEQLMFTAYRVGVVNATIQMNNLVNEIYERKFFCVNTDKKQLSDTINDDEFKTMTELGIMLLDKDGTLDKTQEVTVAFLMGLIATYPCS